MLTIITLLSWPEAQAYDPNSSHTAPKTLSEFTSKPLAVKVSPAEIIKLRGGESILRQEKGSNGGRGVAIQYINAPESTVWDTILDYSNYPKMVDDVVKCSVYERSNSGGQDLRYVEMISSVWGFKFGLYTTNTVNKSNGYMHWALDRRKESDVNDLIGYWRVEQISSNPPVTRVDHSTEMVVTGVPDFIANYLTQDALVSGTAWVKKYAEKR